MSGRRREPGSGLRRVRADLALAAAEQPRDLRVGQAVDIAEDEHSTQPPWQPVQRRPQVRGGSLRVAAACWSSAPVAPTLDRGRHRLR